MGAYSRIITEINARLAYHKAVGRLAAGLIVKPNPVAEIDGSTDFPCIRHFPPGFAQKYMEHGAGRGTLTFRFFVSTSKASGTVVLLEWIEKVMDAICTTGDAASEADPTLGSLCRPPSFQMDRALLNDVGIHGELTMTVEVDEVVFGRTRL